MQQIKEQNVGQWTPLLTGNGEQAARASLQEIAATLKAALDAHYRPLAERRESHYQDYYLGEGAAGVAVFFAYLHAAEVFPGARDLALDYMNLAVDALANQPMPPGLYSGFSGIGWAVQHITTMLGETPDLDEIDSAVETYVSNVPWKDDYDLISGLVGLGVYCLERRGSAAATRSLELIVQRLDELAEHSGDEVCWFTGPEFLIKEQRERFPEGYYNLGLAHGIPGIIALLGKTYAAGIAPEKSRQLLEGAVTWLLKQRLHADASSCFSGFVRRQGEREECRLAWCYGDAGIAAALFLAARCARSKPWEDAAVEIATRSAQRDPETCGVRDVCVCHGSAGLAHIFNRFYQATGKELFATASRYWLDKTLEFRQAGAGAAGYQVWSADPGGSLAFRNRMGLIEGISGVGLMLLAATSVLEPEWDKIFLVDLPPQAAEKE